MHDFLRKYLIAYNAFLVLFIVVSIRYKLMPQNNGRLQAEEKKENAGPGLPPEIPKPESS